MWGGTAKSTNVSSAVNPHPVRGDRDTVAPMKTGMYFFFDLLFVGRSLAGNPARLAPGAAMHRLYSRTLPNPHSPDPGAAQ
jgi:hypothetical protein